MKSADWRTVLRDDALRRDGEKMPVSEGIICPFARQCRQIDAEKKKVHAKARRRQGGRMSESGNKGLAYFAWYADAWENTERKLNNPELASFAGP